MAPNALRWYGLTAVVVGVLFTVSDFVALLVTTLDDPGEEPSQTPTQVGPHCPCSPSHCCRLR